MTLKAIGTNELKTLFINAANALINPDNITMDNYDEVRKAIDKTYSLYSSLSITGQADPNVVVAYQKTRSMYARY